MYFVYVDYFNASNQHGPVKLIYLHSVPDIRAWMLREGFTRFRSFCVRTSADGFIERYIVGDFGTAYDACMYSRRIEPFAKGGYIDYIARMACEFERAIRKRALRAARKLHDSGHVRAAAEAIASLQHAQPGEGAGRG